VAIVKTVIHTLQTYTDICLVQCINLTLRMRITSKEWTTALLLELHLKAMAGI